MKYTWTDWIKHVPGRTLVGGLYIEVEQVGSRTNNGVPYSSQGLLTHILANHPSWRSSSPDELYTMITRYRIRVEEYEQEATDDAQLETV